MDKFRTDCFTYENHAGLWIYNVHPGEDFEDAVLRVHLLRHDFLNTSLHHTYVDIGDTPYFNVVVFRNDGQKTLPHICTRRRWFSSRFWFGDSGPTFQNQNGARWAAGEMKKFISSNEKFIELSREVGYSKAIDIQMNTVMARNRKR